MENEFEKFVGDELPKRISTKDDPLKVTKGKIPVSTGLGLATEFKSVEEVALQGKPGQDGVPGTDGKRGERGERGPAITVLGTKANEAAIKATVNPKEQEAWVSDDKKELWQYVSGKWNNYGDFKSIPSYEIDTIKSDLDKTSDKTDEMYNGEFVEAGLKMETLPKETGYAWALMDKNKKCALLVKLDGTVEIPKFGPAKFFAEELSPETGYVWVVRDSLKRIAIGVKTDGSVVANINDFKMPSFDFLEQTPDFWFLGDSIVGAIYNRLRTIMPDRNWVFGGAGGQTSVQISARAGANNVLLTVENNKIPASGIVKVTALSNLVLTYAKYDGTTTLKGWLGDVYGSLTNTHGSAPDKDAYVFTRDVAGTEVYCTPNTPFTPDTSKLGKCIPVIMMGTNNPRDPDQIIKDFEAIINQGGLINKKFLILTPVMGGTREPGKSTNVGIGTDVYDGIKKVEDWATKYYGRRVIKMREWSMQFNNGSADDLDDVAKGVVPRSIRVDSTHFEDSHSWRVAELVKTKIEMFGW